MSLDCYDVRDVLLSCDAYHILDERDGSASHVDGDGDRLFLFIMVYYLHVVLTDERRAVLCLNCYHCLLCFISVSMNSDLFRCSLRMSAAS